MAASSRSTGENVNFLYRAMVERDPHKRKVKPVDKSMLQLDFGDLGDSSDDSDFKINDLEDDDSDSINSSESKDDGDDDSADADEATTEDSRSDGSYSRKKTGLTISELIEQARIKQAQARQRIASSDLNASPYKILICAVCLGDISEEEDEIVECDSCGVSVHEGCYGIGDTDSVTSTISSSSTEPWFCEACRAGNKNPICELCPNLGGIFKETDVGKWVHIVCALYIPGVAFGNVDKLTPATLFEMPYSKWGARPCGLCEDERYSRTGVCISCDAGLCRNYFHATCAQREGLLSEASPEEVREIADPFFAYCKLHADKMIVRSKRCNWLALRSQVKQKLIENTTDTSEKNRMIRKLNRHQIKYMEAKNAKPHPWVPTQKMPRMLSSSPSACRKLIRKAELLGINTQTLQVQPLNSESIIDIRKKWHITPAFNLEFVSYFLDRNERMLSMQSRLDELLVENVNLQETEQSMRKKYEELFSESEKLKAMNTVLREQGVKLWKILILLDGKKRVMPELLRPAKVVISPLRAGKKYERDVSVTLNKCGLCKRTSDQHLLAKCDTCQLYYHLGCLDPPLTRMPKKTRQQGWQCSECDKTEEEEEEDGVDPNAPRKLREHIKEPVKFTPPASNESNASSSSIASVTQDDAIPQTPASKVKVLRKRQKRLETKKMVTTKTLVVTLVKSPIPTSYSKVKVNEDSIKQEPSTKRKRKSRKILTGRKKIKLSLTAAMEKEREEPSTKKSKRSLSVDILEVKKKQDSGTECSQCKQSGSSSTLVGCDNCQKCYHFACLSPPVKKSPKQRGYTWYCEDCDKSEDEDEMKKDNQEVANKKSTSDSSPVTRRARKTSKDSSKTGSSANSSTS